MAIMHSSPIEFSSFSGGDFVRVPLLSPPATSQAPSASMKSSSYSGLMVGQQDTVLVQPALTQSTLRLPPFQHIAKSADGGAASVTAAANFDPLGSLAKLNRDGANQIPNQAPVLPSPCSPQQSGPRRSSGGTLDLATYAVTLNPLENHKTNAINSLAHLASLSQTAFSPSVAPQSTMQKTTLRGPAEPLSPALGHAQPVFSPYPNAASPESCHSFSASVPASAGVALPVHASVSTPTLVSMPVAIQTQAAEPVRANPNPTVCAAMSPMPTHLFANSPTPSEASSISSCTSSTFERPYKCVYRDCGRSFARVSDQRRHIRSHEKPRLQCPFWKVDASCHRNGGAFNRLDVLKRHLRLVHFVPPTDSDAGWCKCCHKQFTNVRDFIDHAPLCAVRARPQDTA